MSLLRLEGLRKPEREAKSTFQLLRQLADLAVSKLASGPVRQPWFFRSSAWCFRLDHDAGVLKELVDNNEAHFADAGGFVSPNGISYIGVSKEKLGEAACCAVKRINLDVRVAKCAQRTGADLKEGFEVTSAEFDKSAGLWTVTSATGTKVQGRLLVCADGATSRLATKLGYCTEAPKGVCSRAFIEGGTHNTNFDGVCFYPKWSLPGYAAIFRHPNDELNFCYYLIPSGKVSEARTHAAASCPAPPCRRL